MGRVGGGGKEGGGEVDAEALKRKVLASSCQASGFSSGFSLARHPGGREVHRDPLLLPPAGEDRLRTGQGQRSGPLNL